MSPNDADLEAESPESKSESTSTSNAAPIVVIVLGFIALLAVGIGVYVFFATDDPPEVDLDATVAELGETDSTIPNEDVVPPEDVVAEGVWTIDASSDSVGFEDDVTATFVGFRVEEELVSIGSATAVGRTPGVTGELVIEGTELASAEVVADMTGIKTDRSQRDSRVQSALETEEFPTATFVLTSPVDLGQDAIDGEPVTVDAEGELTIHGVTETVTIPLDAQLVEGRVVVVGQVEISFSDYGVEAPTSGSVLSVSDEAIVELRLIFVKP